MVLEQCSVLLCPVWAVRCYIGASAKLSQSEHLFVCYGVLRNVPLCLKRVCHSGCWGYFLSILEGPATHAQVSHLPFHQGYFLFMGCLQAVSLGDICAAVTCTFTRFCNVNVSSSQDVSSAVLCRYPLGLSCKLLLVTFLVWVIHYYSIISGAQKELNRMLVIDVTVVLWIPDDHYVSLEVCAKMLQGGVLSCTVLYPLIHVTSLVYVSRPIWLALQLSTSIAQCLMVIQNV